MDVVGIGIDLIEIDRVDGLIKRFSDAFLTKILTEDERELANGHKNPNHFISGRFAAKEAVAKALKTGFGKYLSFHDINIGNDALGAPYVSLSEKANKHFNNPKILVSISHSKTAATAVAILKV